VHYRTQFQKGDGSALPVEVTLHWIEYEGQPALAVLCRDISSQVRLEAQLIQAEKLSAVGQLVSGVAHELNNPLTTIKGYVQLMQAEQLSPAMAEDLRRVEEAADRCRRIVRDLLTFARRYEPEFVNTDVNELLQRTAALRSYELRVRNIAVRWDLDPLLPEIEADAHRLQQVILNLIFNAEQALLSSEERGLITIRSRTLPHGAGIRFEIADNGPGIRPEHLDRIFDPFFTTKKVGVGTGLGLSISYAIVKEHGGRIWADSGLGEGASFIVELPLAVSREDPSGEGQAD
jgi:two-component system NtrC family sensor kinase